MPTAGLLGFALGGVVVAAIAGLLHARAIRRAQVALEDAWQSRVRELRVEVGAGRDRERLLAATLKSLEQEQGAQVEHLEHDLLRMTVLGRAAETLRADRESERDALVLRLVEADLERRDALAGRDNLEAELVRLSQAHAGCAGILARTERRHEEVGARHAEAAQAWNAEARQLRERLGTLEALPERCQLLEGALLERDRELHLLRVEVERLGQFVPERERRIWLEEEVRQARELLAQADVELAALRSGASTPEESRAEGD